MLDRHILAVQLVLVVDGDISSTEIPVESRKEVRRCPGQPVEPTEGIVVERIEDIVGYVFRGEVDAVAVPQISFEFPQEDVNLDERHLFAFELRWGLRLRLDRGNWGAPCTSCIRGGFPEGSRNAGTKVFFVLRRATWEVRLNWDIQPLAWIPWWKRHAITIRGIVVVIDIREVGRFGYPG